MGKKRLNFFAELFGWYKKTPYLCTRFQEIILEAKKKEAIFRIFTYTFKKKTKAEYTRDRGL